MLVELGVNCAACCAIVEVNLLQEYIFLGHGLTRYDFAWQRTVGVNIHIVHNELGYEQVFASWQYACCFQIILYGAYIIGIDNHIVFGSIADGGNIPCALVPFGIATDTTDVF